MARLFATVLLCLFPLALGAGHWEWAATFDLTAAHHDFSFQKKDGAYADPAIGILVLPLGDSSAASLEAVEPTAMLLWPGDMAVVPEGDHFEVGTSYALTFNQSKATSTFELRVDNAGAYAVFLQHSPYEFEEDQHYLQLSGVDVEPVHEDGGDGHGHGHGETTWEWGATYNLQAGAYTWNFQKTGCANEYVDPSIQILVVSTSGTAEADLEAAEGGAETLWENGTTDVAAGDSFGVGQSYKLIFDQSADDTSFTMNVATGTYAVFLQHVPTEFERDAHFLKDSSSADVEAEHEHVEGAVPWEWAATFSFGAVDYTWSFQKKDGAYADPTIQILVMNIDDVTDEALDVAKANAQTLWAQTTTAVAANSEFGVGQSYTLTMDQNSDDTHFKLEITNPGAHAVFLQHSPYEFERDAHFIKQADDHGHDHGGDVHHEGMDVEPKLEEAAAGHGHGHGGEEEPCPYEWTQSWWEWGATFDFPVGKYTWSFSKKPDEYVDEHMNIIVLKTTGIPGTANTSLIGAEETAPAACSSPTEKMSYDELAVGTCYTLHFDQDTWTTHFVLNVAQAGGHAVFMQHVPYEFENGFHFLQNAAGEDIEPVHEVQQAGGGGEESGHEGHDHGEEEEESGHEGHDHGEEEEEESGHEGHDHGENTGPDNPPCPWNEEWEWSGVFYVMPGVHDFNFEKAADGDYPDATMKIAVYDSGDARFDTLHARARADWAHSSASEQLEAGGTIPRGRAITLKFNPDTWASHYKINVPPASVGGSHIVVFAQHFPIEFEKNYHYLKDATGADVEPEFEQTASSCTTTTSTTTKITETTDLWGQVIGGALATVAPTLVGIFFIMASCAQKIQEMNETGGGWLAVIHCFASGVIFAAAVFLLLPEGLYLTAVGKTEAGGSGAWGTALMGGWLFCVLIKHAGQIFAGSTANGGADGKGVDWTVGVPIIFGDGFHNIADGLVLGTAFKTCTSSFGWKLVLVTVLHELPQELSDFAVLITKARMHWAKATIFNFLSGLTTVIGAIITYSVDVDPGVEGIILTAGGGVYLYVAMTELAPAVTDLVTGEGAAVDSVKRILGFTIGAILLGLILLDHEHCGGENLLSYDPNAKTSGGGEGEEAEDDPHAGHDHAHR